MGLERWDYYSTNKTHEDLKVRTLGGAAQRAHPDARALLEVPEAQAAVLGARCGARRLPRAAAAAEERDARDGLLVPLHRAHHLAQRPPVPQPQLAADAAEAVGARQAVVAVAVDGEREVHVALERSGRLLQAAHVP